MNILPEPITIYDDMHTSIGQLTPWDIQMHHGHINQVMYIFEYRKDGSFYMSIEEPGEAGKFFFDVTKNIEQRYPDSFTRPGLMRPVSIFGMEEEEEHKPSILDKRFVVPQSDDKSSLAAETTESVKDFVESNLKYKITVSTEEMIRRFLHLPMQTHLIIWVRTFDYEKEVLEKTR
ncbi:hypothetical protein LaP1706_gp31 [Lactococcus phage 1706]|uniref:Uncharacterized protein n=1 Tax=Lactococcus phage 1706 TaxID=475178 RepID=B2BTJ5_9CAUD|nr:hypothetical protein LaP1706_gp31 [Lactococcus phage 1706]ABV91238.1 unknown [Lactococcus phage 1706]